MLAFGVQISPKWRAKDARIMAKQRAAAIAAAAEQLQAGRLNVAAGAAAKAKARQQRAYACICEAVSAPVTPEALKAAEDGPKPTMKAIIREVAFVHGFTFQEIVGPLRNKRLVRARHIAIQTVRQMRPDISLPRIGDAFGGRDHTTILHALRRKNISPDPEILARFGYIAGQADENMVQNETARAGAANTETGLTAPIKGADRHG